MKMKGKALLALLLALILTLAIGVGALAAGTEETSPETLPADGTGETDGSGTGGGSGNTDGDSSGGESGGDSGQTGGDSGGDDPSPLPAATVTLSFYDYDGELLAEYAKHTSGAAITEDIPVSVYKKNTAVQHWIMVSGETRTELDSLTSVAPTADTAFYAAWKVTYLATDGTTSLGSELVKLGEKPTNVPTTTGGTTIAGWLDESKKTTTPATTEITGDVSFKAWVRPTLSTNRNLAYVSGYADGSGKVYQFAPSRALTRAEAASMVYKLLSEQTNGPIETSFSDVGTAWYTDAINTLASNGILSGTGAGKFEPTRSISRAEFVVMVSRLVNLGTPTRNNFSDSLPTWCYNAVNAFYEKGWISGYQEDGVTKFKAQNAITRAEAVAILNKVLGRTANKTAIDNANIRLFIDVDDSGYWAYYDIMDAVTGGGNSFPSTGLTAGRYKLNGSYYYVNSSGQFIVKSSGVQEMPDGKYYYYKKTGAGAPAYGAGLRIMGDKLYLLNSDGSIVHEPRSGYDNRVYEYSDRMYYIQADGSLLRNGYFGSLYFNSNGAYTSGDSTLDAWIADFGADIFRSSQSQEAKLLEAYERLRDLPKARYGYGSAGYFRYANITNFSYQELAALFFKNARGSCEEWSSAMVYLARRVGYEATIEEGRLKTTWNNPNASVHAWEVITIRGTKYTFDVEQEWGYMYGYYGSARYDCYKMTYAPSENIYYGSRFNNAIRNIWSPYYYY